MAVKLNSTGGGSVTHDSPSTASNYTITLPSAAGTLATTTGTGSVFTNPTINGFTGDTTAITIGTTQFVKDASGNVGIGTSSPGYRLEVNSGSAAYSSKIRSTTTYSLVTIEDATTTVGAGPYLGALANNLVFGRAGVAEYMRLDASGNLGLGVTPSAWGSAWKAYEYVGGSIASPNNANNLILQNAYATSANYIYKNSGLASNYQQSAGQHIWNTATSGTAGNAITWTQAMTLDASGNLGLGTSSAGSIAKLTVSNTTTTDNSRMGVVASTYLSGPTYAGTFVTQGDAATTGTTCGLSNAGLGSLLFQNTSAALIWTNGGAAIVFATASVERASISGSGVFKINNLAGSGSRAVNADASGNLSAASDSSLKQEDKAAPVPGLKEILKITPRAYKWLADIENRGDEAATEIGFFADEVAPIIPSAAPKCADGLYGFYDRSVTAALVKAIQELSAQNNALEARLAKLEAK